MWHARTILEGSGICVVNKKKKWNPCYSFGVESKIVKKNMRFASNVITIQNYYKKPRVLSQTL